MRIWEEYFVKCEVSCLCLLGLINLQCGSSPLHSLIFWLIYQFLKMGIKVSNYYCRTVCLSSILLLLHILWGPLVLYVQVYHCYIFLLDWTFCQYIMSFVSNFFEFKSVLSNNNIVTVAPFWLLFVWLLFLSL